MDPQARAKYLNGPDTSLFDKGRILYGLPEARRLLHAGADDGALVVVEGYFDVIACQRAGVAAVASMGTALTEAQMEILWRLHPEPTLAFDGDRAGMQAASRAIDRALPLLQPSKSFKFLTISGGKDPDDILRERGSTALKAELAVTTPFVDALFIRDRYGHPLDTPEQKAGLRQRLLKAADAIADADVRAAYRRELVSRLGAVFEVERQIAQPFGQTFWRKNLAPIVSERPKSERRESAGNLARSIDPLAAALARQALIDPPVLDAHLEALQSRGFGDPRLIELAKEIVRLRIDADVLDSEALRRHLAASGFSALLIDIDRAATLAGAPFAKPDVTLAAARSQWSRAFEALHRLMALDNALNDAKRGLAEAERWPAFNALKGERDLLRRAIDARTIWDTDEPV